METIDDIPEDRGFKALFATYPLETFATFAQDILDERGRPVSIVVLGQELGLPDLGQPNRFLDMALLATWADGRQILLVEHWSAARQIDWRRINLSIAHLLVQHPEADVLPVLLVTDPAAVVVPNGWAMPAMGAPVVTLSVRVMQPTEALAPHLLRLRNRVAATLLALAIRNHVEAAVTAVRAFVTAPGTIDEVMRFLPFLESLAMLCLPERDEYRRRLQEDPTMPQTVIEELMAEREAKGIEKGIEQGIAMGQIEIILDLVRKQRLTQEAARAQIADVLAAGTITTAQADAATGELAKLTST